MNIPVETIIRKYFVKYSRLDQLIYYAFSGSNSSSINIYIDLYGLYKSIYSRSYIVDIKDATSITSLLINMAVHYRAYFKKLRVDTKIFFVSAFNMSDMNCKFYAEYNKTFRERKKNQLVDKIINSNIQLLEILCPYLPGIYFIKLNNSESATGIAYIIEKQMLICNNNNPNLIISTDPYPIQLCTRYPNTAFIRPYKNNGEDNSLIIPPNSHLNFNIDFWNIIRRERQQMLLNENDVLISPSNFVLLQALTHFPERNMYSLMNFKKANEIIYSVAGSTQSINVKTLFDIVPDLHDICSAVTSRYYALDVGFQLEQFKSSDPDSVLITFQDLVDNEAIRIINDSYFSDDPIDLMRM